MNLRQKIGKRGESAAVRFLKKSGYKILEQNYRTRLGEIDIIARDRQTIVFIEVKTRRSLGYGSPKMAITPKKQRNISMTALYYLKINDQSHADARFDVVTVLTEGGHADIDIIKNAFELAYF
jgi:putative endonuclease